MQTVDVIRSDSPAEVIFGKRKEKAMKTIVAIIVSVLCGVVVASDYLGGKDGLYGQGRIDATNSVTFVDCTLTGMVYKTGSALLVLDDPQAPDGSLFVELGSARINTSASATSAIDAMILSPGTSAETVIGDDGEMTVGQIESIGSFSKDGHGTLMVKGGYVGTAMKLKEGAVRFVDSEHDDTLIGVQESGKTVSAGDGSIAITGAAAAGSLVKQGPGVLSMSLLPNDMTNVSVNAGTLRFSAPITNDATELVSVDIPNASFEATSTSYSGYSTTAYPTGWTRTNSIDGNGGKVGMCDAGSPWCNASDQYVPDGNHEVFLQADCKLATNVRIPRRGRYRVSFWANARSGFLEGLMHVEIGGIRIADVKVTQTSPRFCAYETPVLEAGENVSLAFAGVDQKNGSSYANRSVVFDDVKMSLIEAVDVGEDPINVSNPGFELSEAMRDANGNPTNIVMCPTEAGWVFSGRGGIVEQWQSGMSLAQNWKFSGDAPPDGRRMAFIGAGGSFSQELDFSSSGTCRIEFSLARPEGTVSTVEIKVALDDVVVTNGLHLVPVGTDFRRYVCFAEATSGRHLLKFMTESATGGDVLIDGIEVRVSDVGGFSGFGDAYPDILSGGANGWIRVSGGSAHTFGGWTYASDSSSANSICGPNTGGTFARPYSGCVSAFIQDMAQVYRANIVLDKAGVYELTFVTAGRNNYLGKKFEVLWNNHRLGMVQTTSTEWKKVSFQIVALADGETGVLAFKGIESAASTCSAFIDAVDLRRINELGVGGVPVLSEELMLNMSADTRLELMFNGTIRVKSVVRGGRRVVGENCEICAAACPGWVSGPGTLKTVPVGFIIQIR